MEDVDTHYTRTALDLQYFGNLIGEPGSLPQLTLHEHGPLNIQLSVIEGTRDEKAERFAKIAADLRTIAEDQALKFTEGMTSHTSADRHHRAVLAMPQGKVTYSVVWIERAEQEVTTDA